MELFRGISGWWMMAVMTVQPPLPLVPEEALAGGAAAAIVEDEDGGRVFVHGNLVYAWDAGDIAGRRLAAGSLVRVKAAPPPGAGEALGGDTAPCARGGGGLPRRGRRGGGVAGQRPHRAGPRRRRRRRRGPLRPSRFGWFPPAGTGTGTGVWLGFGVRAAIRLLGNDLGCRDGVGGRAGAGVDRSGRPWRRAGVGAVRADRGGTAGVHTVRAGPRGGGAP